MTPAQFLVLFPACLALSTAQVASPFSQFRTTYLNAAYGHNLGGFSYQPLAVLSAGPQQTYSTQSLYNVAPRLSSTAVLTSRSEGLSSGPVFQVAPAPAAFHVAPASAAFHVAPAPAAFHVAPAPAAFHVAPAPAAFHVAPAPAPAAFHVASAPAAFHVAPAPVPVAVSTAQSLPAPVLHVNTIQRPQLQHVQIVRTSPLVERAAAVVSPPQLQVQPVTHAVFHHPVVHQIQPVVEHHGDVRVLRFQPDPVNEVRVVERNGPPHFEQVELKDPKVRVVDVETPGRAGMKIFQVTRTPSPPTTVEFVRDAPNETQVTVIDDDGSVHHSIRRDGDRLVTVREVSEPVPVARAKRDKSSARKSSVSQRQSSSPAELSNGSTKKH